MLLSRWVRLGSSARRKFRISCIMRLSTEFREDRFVNLMKEACYEYSARLRAGGHPHLGANVGALACGRAARGLGPGGSAGHLAPGPDPSSRRGCKMQVGCDPLRTAPAGEPRRQNPPFGADISAVLAPTWPRGHVRHAVVGTAGTGPLTSSRWPAGLDRSAAAPKVQPCSTTNQASLPLALAARSASAWGRRPREPPGVEMSMETQIDTGG